jgi:hypothetical protein
VVRSYTTDRSITSYKYKSALHKEITDQHTNQEGIRSIEHDSIGMACSKNARCAALLLLAVLLISCSGMGNAARVLEEMPPPVPEDDYPAEAPEAPEQEQSSLFPDFEIPPFPEPAFPKVELPPMPEMPAIPGFHFSAAQPEADEP